MASKEELSKTIGDAWELHRKGEQASAQRMFEQIVEMDSGNVDAHYGLALAQRAAGDREAAKTSFVRAKALAETQLAEIRAGSNANDLTTTRDDRFMMLIRMLQQRIAEL